MSDQINTALTEQRQTDSALADMLEKLAGGDSVQLGEFSDQASAATEADTLAMQLTEIVSSLRDGSLTVG